MKRASFLYERDNETLRLRMKGMTNDELREILVGCWAALDDDDRADHIRELQHYSTQGSRLSDVAKAIWEHVRIQFH